MYEFFVKIFDALFPPNEETLVVRALTREKMQSLFRVEKIDAVTSLSSYKDVHIRALIHEAKFHGNTQAFALLHVLITQYITAYAPPIDLIIPIPLSPSRLRARGFNQVDEILQAVSSDTITLPIDTSILKRVRNTRPQTELSREERLTNITNAFVVTDTECVRGKHVLVVDDVTTTGATLCAAKAALLPHSPASITLIALAH